MEIKTGKKAIIGGLSFGLTSAIITTIGLMTGLAAATDSKMVIIGGILTIAIADSFSDALAMHLSEEASQKHSENFLLKSSLATLFSKFFFTLLFIIPVILTDVDRAIWYSFAVGLILLAAISFFAARRQDIPAWKVILEHWAVAITVVILTHYSGRYIEYYFQTRGM